VTLNWLIPSPLNAPSSSSVTYKFEIRKADGTNTWIDLVNDTSSTNATLTKIFDMADIKTKALYVTGNKGQPIKIRITATNSLSFASSASEANSDSAVYQEVPIEYAGTTLITINSVTVSSASLSWADLTAPADYGYADAITGWKYWYNSSSGSFTSGTTTQPNRTVALSGLTTPGTTFSFFVEPLTVY